MALRLSGFLRSYSSFLLSLPTFIWLGIFFVIPLFLVVGISFMSRGNGGLPELPLTLSHYERTLGVFSPILWRSIQLAFITMAITLVVGYPLAVFISTRKNNFSKQFALFLVILPFWSNLLIRIYAWRFLLAKEGLINNLLVSLGIAQTPQQLLNNEFAVLLGLVYAYLPFMVLPIYAVVERFNFKHMEAAYDLGANPIVAFFRVMLPMTLSGVLAGCALVFIPTIGTYIAPDMLGGTQGLMIGNLLARQLNSNTPNMPMGAAISVVMLSLVVIPLLLYTRFGNTEKA